MNNSQRKCGIIMPFSVLDDCSLYHWADVRRMLEDCISKAGFNPAFMQLDISKELINENIIKYLCDLPLIICDISCKDSQVLFLLGQRLTLGKPTIIIRDDETQYAVNELLDILEYPRNIQFSQIETFKNNLINWIENINSAPLSKYQQFLNHLMPSRDSSIKRDTVYEPAKDPRENWKPIEIDLPAPSGPHNIPHELDYTGLLKVELNNYSAEMVEKAKSFFNHYKASAEKVSDNQTILIIAQNNIPANVSITMIKNQIGNSLRNLEYHAGE